MIHSPKRSICLSWAFVQPLHSLTVWTKLFCFFPLWVHPSFKPNFFLLEASCKQKIWTRSEKGFCMSGLITLRSFALVDIIQSQEWQKLWKWVFGVIWSLIGSEGLLLDILTSLMSNSMVSSPSLFSSLNLYVTLLCCFVSRLRIEATQSDCLVFVLQKMWIRLTRMCFTVTCVTITVQSAWCWQEWASSTSSWSKVPGNTCWT